MTNWWSFFQTVFIEQFKKLRTIILFNALFLVISVIFMLFSGNRHWGEDLFLNVMIWALVFAIVLLVQTIILTQNQINSNRYQLIPLATWKIYLTQILGVFVNWLIFIVMQACLLIIAFGLVLLEIWQQNRTLYYFMQHFNFFDHINLSVFLLVALISFGWIILSLLFVNTINFTSRISLDYLPLRQSKVVTVVVYLVITWLAIKFLQLMLRWFRTIAFNSMMHMGSLAGNTHANYVLLFGAIVVLLLFNAWLTNYLEPKK